MGTNPVNGNNGQADKSNGLRFRPQQPQVSQEVKDAANPVLKFKVQQQAQNQKALNDPQAYLKEQEKIKQAQEEWAKLSDEEKAEKHKRSEKAKAQFVKEQEAAAKERAEHSVARMADGTVRIGRQKSGGEILEDSVGKALNLTLGVFASCDVVDQAKDDFNTWYNRNNKREATASSETYSESGSTAKADASAHINFDPPEEPIEGNYYDHVEDMLTPLFGDGVRLPGMVEKLDIYKAYDQVLYSGHTNPNESVKSFTFQGQLAKGKQVMDVVRTANPEETNASTSNLSYEISEAQPGLKLVHVNDVPADAVSNFAVALNNSEHRVYMYPYLSSAQENEIIQQVRSEGAADAQQMIHNYETIRDAKLENYFKDILKKAADTGHPYERISGGGAKDGSSNSTVAYTYYESREVNRGGQTMTQVVNVIVTSEGAWQQIVAVNNADDPSTFLNGDRNSFMDNDPSNNLPDQHDPLPNGSKTGRKK